MSQSTPIRVFDVVALTIDLPDRNLLRGQVGTIVETLGADTFEVEFSDNDGRAYAMLAVSAENLMVLHDRPSKVA